MPTFAPSIPFTQLNVNIYNAKVQSASHGVAPTTVMETRRHKALKGRQDHRQGCKPLQRMAVTLAPKGRQSVLPPLRGLGYHTAFSRGFASLHHLPVIFSGLRPYLRNLNKETKTKKTESRAKRKQTSEELTMNG